MIRPYIVKGDYVNDEYIQLENTRHILLVFCIIIRKVKESKARIIHHMMYSFSNVKHI
jgi:hypothetical protein